VFDAKSRSRDKADPLLIDDIERGSNKEPYQTRVRFAGFRTSGLILTLVQFPFARLVVLIAPGHMPSPTNKHQPKTLERTIEETTAE
jgi:hypothetical protein